VEEVQHLRLALSVVACLLVALAPVVSGALVHQVALILERLPKINLPLEALQNKQVGLDRPSGAVASARVGSGLKAHLSGDRDASDAILRTLVRCFLRLERSRFQILYSMK
jgi:hypothetical protein